MTTLQSSAPLSRLVASPGSEHVRQVAFGRDLVLDPPYQRGSVWGAVRQRNLIRSLLRGIPTGAIFLNERPDVNLSVAVVDGRQRIEAVRAFLTGVLAVPASWFPQQDVHGTVDVGDGPYVTFRHLTATGQGRFERCTLTTVRSSLATVAEESELFALVNFGGLAQGEADTDLPTT